MKQRALSFLLAAVLALALAPAAWAAESFTDVPSAHWAYDDIMACAEQGIVTGFADGSFRPGDNVTTVQFLVMMTRTFHADRLNQVVTPAGQPWYYANTNAAEYVGLSDGLTIDENPINRYNMALALYNELFISGKLFFSEEDRNTINVQLENAKASIKDYNSMSKKQQTWVRYCYALGILSGMSDGTFSGESNMTRAQACAVIIRMMNLVGGTTPAAPVTPTQPEQPQQPEPPAETGAGKLANGEDATVENVQAILEDIKKQYPEGTPWGPEGTPNNHWYDSSYQTVAWKLMKSVQSNINCQYGCGGWANMVSTTIFGKDGNPARQVTKNSDLRPGDIVIRMNAKTNVASHVEIVYSVNANGFTTSSGNTAKAVSWGASDAPIETSNAYVYYLAYTRYPD